MQHMEDSKIYRLRENHMQRHIDLEVAEALAKLKKDKEDIEYIKDKFVYMMDRIINKMSEEKEDKEKN